MNINLKLYLNHLYNKTASKLNPTLFTCLFNFKALLLRLKIRIKYIGEGFDDKRLDTLFLTLPISWHGTVAQYAGRLHRENLAKQEVIIYDYVDINVPMLARMAEKRRKGYLNLGYSLGS